MRFVIVTGMSGGGKSTAMRMLEDVGFFCVDNLPVPLIEKFMELLVMPGNEISKAALGAGCEGGSVLWRRHENTGQDAAERLYI